MDATVPTKKISASLFLCFIKIILLLQPYAKIHCIYVVKGRKCLEAPKRSDAVCWWRSIHDMTAECEKSKGGEMIRYKPELYFKSVKGNLMIHMMISRIRSILKYSDFNIEDKAYREILRTVAGDGQLFRCMRDEYFEF